VEIKTCSSPCKIRDPFQTQYDMRCLLEYMVDFNAGSHLCCHARFQLFSARWNNGVFPKLTCQCTEGFEIVTFSLEQRVMVRCAFVVKISVTL
jgi:hypothetical protein